MSLDFFDEEEEFSFDFFDGGVVAVGEGAGGLGAEAGEVVFVSTEGLGLGSCYGYFTLKEQCFWLMIVQITSSLCILFGGLIAV